MKRLIFAIGLFLMLAPSFVQGQVLGTLYLWSDSVRTTGTAIDCTWTDAWENITIKSDTIDVYYRIGTKNDSADWSDHEWRFLQAGERHAYGPATKIIRVEWKSSSGTGNVWFIGEKKVKQH